mgnify:FL=1
MKLWQAKYQDHCQQCCQGLFHFHFLFLSFSVPRCIGSRFRSYYIDSDTAFEAPQGDILFGKKLRTFLPHCDFILIHLFAEHKFSFHRPRTGFSQKLSTFSTGFSTGQAVEKPVISCIFWETVKKSPQHPSQLWRFSVDRTPSYPLFHFFGLSKTQPSFLCSTGEQ